MALLTSRIGCHDNGYVTTLRSQITTGFKHKLILLRGYTDMASGINELELPSFTIPDLFLPQKLTAIMQTSPTASPAPQFQTIAEEPKQKSATTTIQQDFDLLPFASVDRIEMSPPKLCPAPLSYSSAVQTPKRPETPELDSSGSTTSSDGGDNNFSMLRPCLSNARSRRLNPNIVSAVVVHQRYWLLPNVSVASF